VQVALLRNYTNGLTALVASLKSALSLKPDRALHSRGTAWLQTQVTASQQQQQQHQKHIHAGAAHSGHTTAKRLASASDYSLK
jgi:hypothetical protein